MKKFFTLAIAMITVFAVQSQTADQVISKYYTAVGGKAKLNGIKTLQFVQTISLATPMGDMEMTLTNIKVANKLLRINTSSDLLGNAYSVVTDTSGWIMIPAGQFTGNKAVVQKLKPEERKAFKSQMDCAGYFPELVDYAAKGYKAEYLGEGQGNGKASYKIQLKKDKDERVYFIDKQTGIVNSLSVKGEAAAAFIGMGGMGQGGGNEDKLEITVNFSDYKESSGVKFPGKMSIDTPMGKVSSTIAFVSINQPIDAKWYRAE